MLGSHVHFFAHASVTKLTAPAHAPYSLSTAAKRDCRFCVSEQLWQLNDAHYPCTLDSTTVAGLL